jgi:hypothetical protein
MSEFKYACPVCAQHISCDSSQAGSVMECPTCFQKIVVPQAPATSDSKFILTGSKFVEKKIPETLAAAAHPISLPQKNFPVSGIAVALLLVLALAAGAAVFVLRGKIFKGAEQPPGVPQKVAVATNAAPPKPKVVAPPANDANWTLALGTNFIPDAPAAGRIHGEDFTAERTTFQNGSLALRLGRGNAEFGLTINFPGAQPEAMSGKAINITTNVQKAARVTFHWHDDAGKTQRENFEDGYALRLEFGDLANNRLPGKIYLCTPDEKRSYLAGTFNADARKPKPKPQASSNSFTSPPSSSPK